MSEVFVPYYDDIKTLIVDGFKRGGDKLQFIYTDKNKNEQNKTFREVEKDVNDIAAYMYHCGLKGHEKIAILSDNSYEWNVAFYATAVSGNINVPLDPKLSASELAGQLLNCACTAIIFSSNYLQTVEKIQSEYGVIFHQQFNMEHFVDYYAQAEDYSAEIKEKSISTQVQPQDLAAIVYTSGTTGKTKGVMLSHKNIASSTCAACRANSGSHAIGFLPLNHTYSWATGLFAGLIFSEWGYICTNLLHIYKDIKKYTPTNFAAVPMAVEMIYQSIIQNAKKQGKYDSLKSGIETVRNFRMAGLDIRRDTFKDIHDNLGGKLEFIMCGGAHLDVETEEFMDDIGIDIITGYGLTECSPCVTCTRKGDLKPGSVGQVLDCCEIKINNPDENGIGEIYVKGDNVMMGYYNDEEATRSVFDGEWFKTGDLGYIDYEDFLFFTGRKKNLIILSNGKNVSPEEVEDELYRIPYVKEVLVYAENDKIVAEFYLDPDEADNVKSGLNDDVYAALESLADFKHPQIIRLRDTEFEKTTTLKIRRKY